MADEGSGATIANTLVVQGLTIFNLVENSGAVYTTLLAKLLSQPASPYQCLHRCSCYDYENTYAACLVAALYHERDQRESQYPQAAILQNRCGNCTLVSGTFLVALLHRLVHHAPCSFRAGSR